MSDADAEERASIHPRKLDCWEAMQCGREPGGDRVAEMGVCPAALERRLDGVLGGTNAGRCCWLVAGTFCKGEPAGTFAKRLSTCRDCEFFERVHAEESPFLAQAESLLLYLSSVETEQREHYSQLLTRMIDPDVIRYALGHSRTLGNGNEKHITALFTDLTGFSGVAGELDATSLGTFLNAYLSAMTEVLKSEGGTLDKYIGDAVVGIFGAPTPLENDALSGARAALRMQQRFSQLRDEWRERGLWCPRAWSLEMRIGLSSGLAKVGFMGTSAFASYTMSGASVNLAKWLEQACKRYGTAILVSEATHDLIASEMVLRRIATVRPKGNVGRESIFELLGPRGDAAPEVLRAAEGYEAALRLYDDGRWRAAAKQLRKTRNPHAPPDRAAKLLLRRCNRLLVAKGRRSSAR